MRAITSLFAMNRGVISPLGLARVDVKRLAMAAETQTNWMPRVLGSMMLRPGLKHIGATLNNAAARFLRFIFATDDTALLELTTGALRIWISDVLLTRPAVTTTITNPNFTGSLAGWTNHDEAGATSSWGGNNSMALLGNGSAYAIEEQQVTVAGTNIGVEHGLRIVISRGPVVLLVGSSSGNDDYVNETTLGTGTHSLSITPTGDFYVRFQNRLDRPTYVYSCDIEAAGAVSLPTPWLAADLDYVREDQSGDVVYLACDGYQQRKIERRGTRPAARSWSIVLYQPEDGPFKLQNVSATTLTPSGLTGVVSLTASGSLFRSAHVGALFSLTSSGQDVTKSGGATNDATASIRVIGTGDDRTISYSIQGCASGSTIKLQRSYDDASWTDVGGTYVWTADTSGTYTDGLNNQIVYYRLLLSNRVAPDLVVMHLVYGAGTTRGIVRLTSVSTALIAQGEVLAPLGALTSTPDWQEGQWSDFRGWPSSVRFHEGRLWWSGLNGIWGSISDAYDSFDETYLGNAGPINRTIGSGPVDMVNWMMSLKGLMVGTEGTEYMARASSLDEPLTPTNFNVKASSTQGSGGVEAVKVDQGGYFVNRSGVKVFEIAFSLQDYDYTSRNLMELAPDIGRPGITRMDVQRQPDTRVHCVRTDGTAVVAVMNKAEDVLAWIPVTSPGASGVIEDVVILPGVAGSSDDQVYYVVKRTIGGATVRYLEKWAQEIDCLGDKQYCYLADSFVHYSGTATNYITGLGHLEGEQVVVWADGQDVGTVDTVRPWTQLYTVSGGAITLAAEAAEVVVGLGYTAPFKSAKLGASLNGMTPLNQQKQLKHLGLVLANIYRRKGLKLGPTLDDTGSMLMDDMPLIEDGTGVGTGTATAYDQNLIEFPGTWTTDMRVCLQAQAPRPATVLAVTTDGVQNS